MCVPSLIYPTFLQVTSLILVPRFPLLDIQHFLKCEPPTSLILVPPLPLSSLEKGPLLHSTEPAACRLNTMWILLGLIVTFEESRERRGAAMV